MNKDYEEHLFKLQRYWSEPSTYAKVGEYVESVKKSSMTSSDIGMLRDSISNEATQSDSWQRRRVLKGLLEDAYQSRLREEIRGAKPWITRMMEQHSTAIILFWLLTVVLGGIVGFYLKQLLESAK